MNGRVNCESSESNWQACRTTRSVLLYDYADLQVPMLARMHARRLDGYRAIGYRVQT